MGIFKSYDIRGIVGEDLTYEKAYLIGFYLPRYLSIKKCFVSHDLRESHENITKCFIQGFLNAGGEVVYRGESSTPNFYFSLFEEVGTGVQITASHNPREYNGFKIMHNLEFLDAKTGLVQFGEMVEKDEAGQKDVFAKISKKLLKTSLKSFLTRNKLKKCSMRKEYVKYLVDSYKRILRVKERKILRNVVFGLDFSSGVPSLALVPFCNKVKLNFKFYNEIPDGTFPVHSPDPNLAGEFLKSKNDLVDSVAVFDGDGDRMMVYDEEKTLIPQDLVIAKFMDYFSSFDSMDKKFACDLTISRCVDELGKKNGFNVTRLPVGRSKFTPYMMQNDVGFAGELSGHLFFREFKYFDNPDIAFIYYLKLRAQDLLLGVFSCRKSFEKYNVFFRHPIINLHVESTAKSIELLRGRFGQFIVSEMDGLSFDLKEVWFNVRKSNTEPVLRINIEGLDKEKVLAQILEIKKVLGV